MLQHGTQLAVVHHDELLLSQFLLHAPLHLLRTDSITQVEHFTAPAAAAGKTGVGMRRSGSFRIDRVRD